MPACSALLVCCADAWHVAYKPVHDLLQRMTILASWLMGLTAIFAWIWGRFYRRQTESARRLEREVVFNEKILAKGDSQDPLELYRSFMGRDPSLDPLMKRQGLAA